MNCPICKGETRIVRTEGVERRRECTGTVGERPGCGARFSTIEVLKEEHQRQREAVQTVREAAEKLKVEA